MYISLVWSIWLVLLPKPYQHPTVQERYQTQEGKVSFTSDAPLELIRASTDELYGVIDAEEETFAFSVAIRSFEGFNSPLQKEHFNEKYLNSDKYPKATFTGKLIERLDPYQLGNTILRAKGILSIHGIAQERIIKSTVNIREGVIDINANFTVPLSDHNIKVPKVVNQKIARMILVEISASLKLQS